MSRERQQGSKDQTCSDFYKSFAYDSPLQPGDHGIPSADLAIENTDLDDPQLIEEGRQFVRDNLFSVILCHMIMMMWALASKFGRVVILHTGESSTKERATRRDLSTMLRIIRWFDGDFSSKGSGNDTSRPSSIKDLETVRKIHQFSAKMHPLKPKPTFPKLTERQKQVLEAIRRETAYIDDSLAPDHIHRHDPEIPLSQYPMSSGQLGFMGSLVFAPERFGMTDSKGIDGYVHVWAIIGRHLGIEDRFNWGLHYKKTGRKQEMLEAVKKLLWPTVKVMDETAIVTWQAMIDGVEEYIPIIRFLPVVKYMLNVCNLEGACIDPLMDWKDKISYWFLMFAIHFCGKFLILRKIRNFIIWECLMHGERKFLSTGTKHGSAGVASKTSLRLLYGIGAVTFAFWCLLLSRLSATSYSRCDYV